MICRTNVDSMEKPDNKYSFEFRHDLQRAFSSEDRVRALNLSESKNQTISPQFHVHLGGIMFNNAPAEAFHCFSFFFQKRGPLFIMFERYLSFPSFLSHSLGTLSTFAPAGVRIFLNGRTGRSATQ